MTEHTPTPWIADPDWREGYSWNIHIVDGANPDMRICFMTSDGPAQANADLIVKAVNNHARLTAALSRAEKALQPFANCVFNDNGDVTVTTHYLQIEDYMRAHTALSSISEPVK